MIVRGEGRTQSVRKAVIVVQSPCYVDLVPVSYWVLQLLYEPFT